MKSQSPRRGRGVTEFGGKPMSSAAIRMGLLALGLATLLSRAAAAQQPVGDFYRGKTIDFLVGYPPGAGYDTYGRALAQFMGKFIPGRPAIVVQNMPGASSLKALQYLSAQAPRDGTAIGIFNPQLVNLSMLEPDTVNVDFSKLTLLGNMSSDTKVCFAWKGSGVKSVEDLRKRPFVIGGTSQGAGFIYGAIMRAVFDDKMKIVLGYPSNSDVWLAMERGEADGNCTGWGVIPAMRPDWIRDNKVKVLVQFAETPKSGTCRPRRQSTIKICRRSSRPLSTF